MKGNKHLFEIKTNSDSGSSDSSRSTNIVPVTRQRQGVFTKKGRGTIALIEGKHFFYRCRSGNVSDAHPKELCFLLIFSPVAISRVVVISAFLLCLQTVLWDVMLL